MWTNAVWYLLIKRFISEFIWCWLLRLINHSTALGIVQERRPHCAGFPLPEDIVAIAPFFCNRCTYFFCCDLCIGDGGKVAIKLFLEMSRLFLVPFGSFVPSWMCIFRESNCDSSLSVCYSIFKSSLRTSFRSFWDVMSQFSFRIFF